VSTDEFSTYDAAYVLGALSPPERSAFEAHLRTCTSCAAGVTALAGLPGLLAKVPLEQVIDPAPVPLPKTLLPRLLREVAARRRRRRWVTGLSAAAAAVAIGTGAGVVGSSLAPDQRPATPPAATSRVPGRDLVAVVPSRVTASVAMVPMTWGTRLDLRCEYYASGGGAAREYTLVVHDRNGRSQQVAAWQALPGQELAVPAASSWHPRDIANVEVQAPDGRPLLRLTN
jgi:hypothetical protein